MAVGKFRKFLFPTHLRVSVLVDLLIMSTKYFFTSFLLRGGGGGGVGRVVRWCWVSVPVPGRPTILITVGQGLAVGAGGGCLDIFTLNYPFFLLSPSLLETARYRLNYCLKGPLHPKPTNQPT